MKDVRIDQDGELRCWNCGAKGFTEKRTFRSKALVGVGALLTKKKLKCQVCGEYNDTGNAKPYEGPASRKYRKQYDAEKTAQAHAPSRPEPSEDERLVKLERLASLHASGALNDDEYATMKAESWRHRRAQWSKPTPWSDPTTTSERSFRIANR